MNASLLVSSCDSAFRRRISLLSTELNQPPSVKTTAALFQQLCYENKDRLMAGIIVGGWDAVDKASLYSIPLGGAVPSFAHVTIFLPLLCLVRPFSFFLRFCFFAWG